MSTFTRSVAGAVLALSAVAASEALAATITQLSPGAGGGLTLRWQADGGAPCDVYASSDSVGADMAWEKIASGVTDGAAAVELPGGGAWLVLQVVGAGEPPSAHGLWGAITLTFPHGHTLAAPPLVSDRRFDGALGAQLAAALSGHDGGPAAGADEIGILDPGTDSWTTLHLDGRGRWLTAEGAMYAGVLEPGQGFVVKRNAASTARAIFTGVVGQDGAGTLVLREGKNLVGPSQGREVPLNALFAQPLSGSPAASFDEAKADLVALLNQDGSWRRFLRVPDGAWLDLQTMQPASYVVQPGQAFYFERPAGAGPLTVRF